MRTDRNVADQLAPMLNRSTLFGPNPALALNFWEYHPQISGIARVHDCLANFVIIQYVRATAPIDGSFLDTASIETAFLVHNLGIRCVC